jgi:hypothetical protein
MPKTQLLFLGLKSEFARQIYNLPDGTEINFKFVP